MNRRRFTSLAIASAAIAPFAGLVNARDTQPSSPDRFTYRGYDVFWTGWKGSHDTARVTGQWLTRPPGGKAFIYSSVPGGHGEYVKGQPFDIACYAPQVWIETTTPEDIKNQEKANGLAVMKRLIDERA